MDGFLTPVSTSYKTPIRDGDALIEAAKDPASKVRTVQDFEPPSTPDQALEVLKSEPDYTALIATLKLLARKNEAFSITVPSPTSAQLIHVLVSETVPNYWDVLSEKGINSLDLKLLLSCLRSVTGLNAVLVGLRRQIQLSKETKKAVRGQGVQEALRIHLQLIQALFLGHDVVHQIWKQIYESSPNDFKQKATWQEFLSIVASGRILGLAAEAESVISELSSSISERYWIASGGQYSHWLAGNISTLAKSLPAGTQGGSKSCGELLSKSLRLGHAGAYQNLSSNHVDMSRHHCQDFDQ